MKKLLSLLLCVPMYLFAQTDINYQGIKFEKELTWEQIKAKAKADNKYIFVDCYATWCGPCKMMERDIYPEVHVGYEMNEHFVSVKVQMDSTGNDDEHTRAWYATASDMMQRYKIGAFPAYLFFTPDGQYVHQAVGYMSVDNFIKLSKLARDPEKPMYYARYEAYKQGKKEYSTMDSLALFTSKLIGDDQTAEKMALDYKKHYLNKLPLQELYTKQHIGFMLNFRDLVNSKDRIFTLAYKTPEKFDSIAGSRGGAAKKLVDEVITREEIAARVLKNGKAVNKMPDWDAPTKSIAKKYRAVDAKKLVLQYKVDYYRNLYKDWTLWAKYKDEMIKTYPPIPPYGLQVYVEINGFGGAWLAFLNCPDTAVLLKALEWVDLAIKLDGEDKISRASYWDTKANLLYKLGRKEDALKLEKEALDLLISVNGNTVGLVEAYNKMRKGVPTWNVN